MLSITDLHKACYNNGITADLALRRASCMSCDSGKQIVKLDDLRLCENETLCVVALQDLAMFAAGNPLSGVTEQLQAAGVHVPSNSLVSARSTSSLASSRSGSLSSLTTSSKVAPQRSMRLSTGSIG